MPAFGDRRLLHQASLALIRANARFWPSVLPIALKQLRHWEHRAQAIQAQPLKAIALHKLHEERFNAEVAATLATIVPRQYRRAAIQAIVAYEVMYDYLDGLTEQPTHDPLRDRQLLYQAFLDAVSADQPRDTDYYARHPEDDGGYLHELASAVRRSLGSLPASAAIAQTAADAAARCAQAQTRAHAIPQLGTAQLEEWPRRRSSDTGMPWRQYMAGSAASVLAVHALIAAAADVRTTPADARALDATYLSICAVSTLLDALVDYEQDLRDRGLTYLSYYEQPSELAQDLAECARRVLHDAARLRDGGHHAMTLVGVAAYYISAPTARTTTASPITRKLTSELEPLMTPTLAVLRTWRAAKHIRSQAKTDKPSYGTA